MTKIRRVAICVLLAGPLSLGLNAQPRLSGPAQIEARTAELKSIQEQLGDPDPLKRQAAIQVIVESGDANKIDFALKIALASEDAAVRATALRAYMAHLKTLQFEIQAPPDVQRQIDAALASDPERLKDLSERLRYIRDLSGAGYRLQFALKGYSMSSGTGTAGVTAGGYSESAFTVSGDRVSGRADIFYSAGKCTYSFQPQVLVKGAPPILRGALTCANANQIYLYPAFTITAPVF